MAVSSLLMQATEGVIKYRLRHESRLLPADIELSRLESWRQHFHRLGLIAQDPGRYGGHGFGNISQRQPLPGQAHAFVISGSQTAHLDRLDRSHYALVTDFDIAHNSIQAIGETPPSSEALTHAVVYRQLTWVQGVIHVHDPLLWRAASQLGLPVSATDIEYGTVEMAEELARLLYDGTTRRPILSMGGHEDGVIAWGESLDQAAETLIHYHRRAADRLS